MKLVTQYGYLGLERRPGYTLLVANESRREEVPNEEPCQGYGMGSRRFLATGIAVFLSVWFSGSRSTLAQAISCGNVLSPGTTIVLNADVGSCDDNTDPAVTVEWCDPKFKWLQRHL